MAPTPAPRIPVLLKEEKLLCLVSLCILLVAINEACKAKNHVTYSSGHTDHDSRLTDYQNFLCKLAQICDIQKGGDTVTALVALRGSQGPSYLFASNNRKEMELERAKKFLFDLLDTVGRNADNLNEKPLRKQVLWRILEFNFPRFSLYLKNLTSALADCIEDCRRQGELQNWDTINKLQHLKAKAEFPRDMSSSKNAKSKFLCDCELLIRAIQNNKSDPINQTIENYADGRDVAQSVSWCELRHHLGRLLSYRRASDIIVDAPKKWPSLFQNFTVGYIPSARIGRISTLKQLASPIEVIRGAFPDLDLSEYESHIHNLQHYRLDDRIHGQLAPKIFKARIHCEVHLHDNLVQQGKTDAGDFWDGSKFIATSKPPCRLCYHYFQDPNNSDFQLRASHMNLYMKWQLPNVYEDQGVEAANRREEVMENITELLQESTLQILKDQFPMWRKNDSRTDSRTTLSATRRYSDTSYSDTLSWSPGLRMERSTVGRQTLDEFTVPHPPTAGESDWVIVEEPFERIEMDEEEAARMGVAR